MTLQLQAGYLRVLKTLRVSQIYERFDAVNGHLFH